MNISYSINQYCQQRQKEKPVWVYPVLMAMQAQYYRDQGHNVYWDTYCPYPEKIITQAENIDFLELPAPDRIWTRADSPRYQRYGNYKYLPATHMQVADGCWWGKCKFCVERKKNYVVRPMGSVLQEIDECHNLGFREIFDDSGTFPDGKWLTEFCIKMIQRPYRMVLGCNMRIGADVDFKLMKQAGFRMLLYGIESASQRTLNQINKGVDIEKVIPTLKRAVKSGLEPHGAFMFGCPGQSESEEVETLKLVHYLLRKGILHTAQASVYTVENYKGKNTEYVKQIYNAALYPDFWWNKIKSIRNVDDIKYLIKQIRKGIVRD